jgi:hypothetical protein
LWFVGHQHHTPPKYSEMKRSSVVLAHNNIGTTHSTHTAHTLTTHTHKN